MKTLTYVFTLELSQYLHRHLQPYLEKRKSNLNDYPLKLSWSQILSIISKQVQHTTCESGISSHLPCCSVSQ